MNAKTFPLPFQIEDKRSIHGALVRNRFAKSLCTMLFILTIPSIAVAQVVIGSNNEPERAALLELKTQNAERSNISSVSDDANVTSTKGGLVLPRVRLLNPTTLEPFISASDPAWTSNASKIKEKHAGLSVYNLASDAYFMPGVYSWSGERWTLVATPNIHPGSGISLLGDQLELGGTVTRASEVDNGAWQVTVIGHDSLNIGSPLRISGQFKYVDGNQAANKLLMSDSIGYASWQPQAELPPTPTAVLSANGVSGINLRDYVGANKWRDTNASITLPPGRWFVMVTMRAVITSASFNQAEWIWLSTTFIAENETLPNMAYFEGNNWLISGRLLNIKQIMNGYVIINNTTRRPIKFRYHLGAVELGGVSSNYKIEIDKFASSAFPENVIVAFALVE
ncbi:MAG: hypothetical protein LBD28_02565 [Tannerellaceae bacterium]|jgi:hypothetical protein|nr:hypothetical protein [Tannerellaceae bacterium]